MCLPTILAFTLACAWNQKIHQIFPSTKKETFRQEVHTTSIAIEQEKNSKHNDLSPSLVLYNDKCKDIFILFSTRLLKFIKPTSLICQLKIKTLKVLKYSTQD